MDSANGETVPLYKCCRQKAVVSILITPPCGKYTKSMVSLAEFLFHGAPFELPPSVVGDTMHFHISLSEIKLNKENK